MPSPAWLQVRPPPGPSSLETGPVPCTVSAAHPGSRTQRRGVRRLVSTIQSCAPGRPASRRAPGAHSPGWRQHRRKGPSFRAFSDCGLGAAHAEGEVDALAARSACRSFSRRSKDSAGFARRNRLQHPATQISPKVTEAETRITPANPRDAFGHLADQSVKIVQERRGAGQQVLARRGQTDLARRPLQQPDTQPCLKLGHVFRGQPVRHAKLIRRRREGPGLRCGHEGA